MNIKQKLLQINQRLKIARLGVTILMRGNKLYLQATLPPRPNSNKPEAHQQQISLGIYANPEGLKSAEIAAKKLGAEIASRSFRWSDYISIEQPSAKPILISELLIAFEEEYFSRKDRNPKSESTWYDHMKIYRRLPQDSPLTSDIIKSLILGTKPDTRSRKKYCEYLGRLADFAGVELDFNIKDYKGKYSPKSVNPRELPTDEEIDYWCNVLNNPCWKWVYSMLHCFGLRPHEAWHLDLEAFREQKGEILYVLEGKTGKRFTLPLPNKQVIEKYSLLSGEPPKLKYRNNSDLGHRVSNMFAWYSIPFQAYSLRHVYCRRAFEVGLGAELTAKLMGHSLTVALNSYRAW